MSEQEDIFRKIRGLLRKAEGTQFEDEATAFLNKAQEMMFKYAVDEEQLWASEPESRPGITVMDVEIKDRKAGAMEYRKLLNVCAKYNRCKAWYKPGWSVTHVAGFPSDLVYVEMLYVSISTQMRFALAIGLAKKVEHPKVFRANFMEGYVARIAERFRENETSMKSTSTGSTALAIRNREDQVKDYVQREIGTLVTRNVRRMGRSSFEAHEAGRNAASNADITGGRNTLKGRRELSR